ncbi:MAG: hypothetical protein DRN08_04195 [Thermoplasmata archaeon]|nr:MAG: hypothetical protein DRN08_04195 [Thermoplasmata archaeon]
MKESIVAVSGTPTDLRTMQSRFVIGYGVFEKIASFNNTKVVFRQTIQDYVTPDAVMTDHGTQFVSLSRGNHPDS